MRSLTSAWGVGGVLRRDLARPWLAVLMLCGIAVQPLSATERVFSGRVVSSTGAALSGARVFLLTDEAIREALGGAGWSHCASLSELSPDVAQGLANRLPRTTTGDDGVFGLASPTASLLPRGVRWPTLVVHASRHLGRIVTLPSLEQCGDDLGEIVLGRDDEPSTSWVRGTVRDCAGAAVAGCRLWTSGEAPSIWRHAGGADRQQQRYARALLQSLGSTVSGADGSFALPLASERVGLRYQDAARKVHSLDVSDLSGPIEISLPPPGRRLHGRIVGPFGDVPASPSLVAMEDGMSRAVFCLDMQITLDPEASLHAFARSLSAGRSGCRSASVAADGSFTIDGAPDGDLELSFAAAGWRTQVFSVSEQAAGGELLLTVKRVAPLAVVLSAADRPWAAALARDSGTVTAWQLPFVSSVADITSGGLMVPLESSVQLLDDQLLLEVRLEVTDGGALALLIPGAYPLIWSVSESLAEPRSLRGSLVAQPPLPGRVVDEAGAPLAGVRLQPTVWYQLTSSSHLDVVLLRTLWLARPGNDRLATVTSDSDGRFLLPLRPPPSAQHEQGPLLLAWQGAGLVSGATILADGSALKEPLVLHRAAGVAGRASLVDGTPAVGVRISITPRTRESCRTTRWQEDGRWFEITYIAPVAEVLAGCDGNYQIDGLEKGDYCLLATTPEGSVAGPLPFSVTAGEQLLLDAVLSQR